MAPGRDLILAKLEGGPLANTGVIAGMSGSPVYIDNRLVGAVSYSLGSFAREPIAGITPIAEMVTAVRANGPRAASSEFDLAWPSTPESLRHSGEWSNARQRHSVLRSDLRTSWVRRRWPIGLRGFGPSAPR